MLQRSLKLFQAVHQRSAVSGTLFWAYCVMSSTTTTTTAGASSVATATSVLHSNTVPHTALHLQDQTTARQDANTSVVSPSTVPYTAISVGVVNTPTITPFLLKPESADKTEYEQCRSEKCDMETMSNKESVLAFLKDDTVGKEDEMETEENSIRKEICETNASKEHSSSLADPVLFHSTEANKDSDTSFSLDDLPLAFEVLEKQALEECTTSYTTPYGKGRHQRKRQEDKDVSCSATEETDDNTRPSRSRKKKKKVKLAPTQTDDSTASPKKPNRQAPNAFVAVRINSPEVHSKVAAMQEAMVKFDPGLSAVMVSTKKLHLTLMVMALKNDDDIDRAKLALSKSSERASKDLTGSLQLDFAGTGNFRNAVVFVEVTDKEEIIALAKIVREEFASSGIELLDKRPFAAHLTVCKLSRVSRRGRKGKKVRSIPSESYASFQEAIFGSDRVSDIELLSMSEPVDSEGYYYMFDKQPLVTCSSHDSVIN